MLSAKKIYDYQEERLKIARDRTYLLSRHLYDEQFNLQQEIDKKSKKNENLLGSTIRYESYITASKDVINNPSESKIHKEKAKGVIETNQALLTATLPLRDKITKKLE